MPNDFYEMSEYQYKRITQTNVGNGPFDIA